jgi:ParB-like chromosome segregation protein Spo0J
MKTLDQQFATVPIGDVRPHPRNPRRGNLAAIANSISVNGWYGSLVVQRSTGYILAGNHRYRSALVSGATSLPVCYLDIDDEQALRILLTDNRTSDLATQDEDELALLLAELAGSDLGLDGTGYRDADLEQLLLETVDTADDQSDELVEGFEVIVTCQDESQQRQLLTRLQEEGYACRALAS